MLGVNHRVMVAGIAIALAGAYEEDAALGSSDTNTEVFPPLASSLPPYLPSFSSSPSTGSLLS